jgi:hypothetical protein
MIALYGEVNSISKDDIIAVVKAVASLSILMKISRLKAVSGYHLTKTQDCHINVNNKMVHAKITSCLYSSN